MPARPLAYKEAHEMEEQDRIETEDEDVEAHRRARKLPMAAEEASDEAEGDDVEAHSLRQRPQSL
ncbi:MAG: hypothetical protein WD249_01645 [Gaiellaceae bacterium]